MNLDPKTPGPAESKWLERAVTLEREAQGFRSENRIDEAFHAYDQAAAFYARSGEPLKAAVCYASAASCWNLRTGLQPLRNAASRSAMAAEEAMKADHPDYARSLFVEAAHLYEKEGDSGKYSTYYYRSKIADRKFLWQLFISGKKEEGVLGGFGEAGYGERWLSLGRWFTNVLNYLIWGYGERPFRTFATACFIISFNALIYTLSGQVSDGGPPQTLSIFEGFYMSVMTFSTVGYGDFVPLGGVRAFAMLEGLSGIFLAPLFLVALTRRYLRTYR